MKNRRTTFLGLLLYFLLILCKPPTATCQEILNVYRDYIAKDILGNKDVASQLSLNLEAWSQLNPELIYHYIAFYNQLFQKGESPDSQRVVGLRRNIDLATQHFVSLRNSWAERQIEILDTLDTRTILKNKAKQEFQGLITESVFKQTRADSGAPVDSNKLNYFVALFYRQDGLGQYDPRTDYRRIRTLLEVHQRKLLVDRSDSATFLPTSFSSNAMKSILLKWYLFDTTLREDESDQINSQPSEIFVKLFGQELSTLDLPKCHLGIGYTTYSFPFANLPADISITGSWLYPKPTVYPIDVKIEPRYCASVGYNIFLSNYMDIFSYVALNLDYAGSPSPFEARPNNADSIAGTNSRGEPTIYDSIVFDNNSQIRKSLQRYSVGIRVPVLILFNSVFVEVGVLGGLYHLTYSFDYHYDHSWGELTRQNSYLRYDVSDSGTVKVNRQFTYVSPVVDFKVQLARHFSALAYFYWKPHSYWKDSSLILEYDL